MNIDALDRKELIELKRNCEKKIREKSINNNLLAGNLLTEKYNGFHINDNVYSFYQKTDIKDLAFLYRSMKHFPSVNHNGSLYTYDLLYRNPEYRELLRKYNIRNNLELYRKQDGTTKLVKGLDDLNEAILNTFKIAYLVDFFKDFDNVYAYQSIYNVFLYITNTLNNVLKDIEVFTDEECEAKKKIIIENLRDIANYLSSYRDSIPNAKLSLANNSISKMPSQKLDVITFNVSTLVDAISFGTSLEKLEKKDYEDCKSLVFIPFKK